MSEAEDVAEMMVKGIEETLPPRWATDDLGDFWHRMAELVTLRLIRYKPELVTKWPPDADGGA